MTEREKIIAIFERMGQNVSECSTTVSTAESCVAMDFGAHGYIEFEFDENGNVVDIWG